jgi:hypothetical protein
VKLHLVWNSRNAWQNLAALKKAPRLAYRLAKYHKQLMEEYNICEKQREAFIYEAAGVTPPEPPEVLIVNIPSRVMTEATEEEPSHEIDNPQFVGFLTKFNEFMQGDSDLELVGVTMDELIEGLAPDAFISQDDLVLLEPFFS